MRLRVCPQTGRMARPHDSQPGLVAGAGAIEAVGELIRVLGGVSVGGRLQGRNIAVMTYIGDGGQSTGVTYEGLNFAAVQNLGLVLFVENNLWGYSTPADMQFRVKDLAERAIAYRIPCIIIDGTHPSQVYHAAH